MSLRSRVPFAASSKAGFLNFLGGHVLVDFHDSHFLQQHFSMAFCRPPLLNCVKHSFGRSGMT